MVAVALNGRSGLAVLDDSAAVARRGAPELTRAAAAGAQRFHQSRSGIKRRPGSRLEVDRLRGCHARWQDDATNLAQELLRAHRRGGLVSLTTQNSSLRPSQWARRRRAQTVPLARRLSPSTLGGGRSPRLSFGCLAVTGLLTRSPLPGGARGDPESGGCSKVRRRKVAAIQAQRACQLCWRDWCRIAAPAGQRATHGRKAGLQVPVVRGASGPSNQMSASILTRSKSDSRSRLMRSMAH